jgi:hypothetical protein
MKGTIGRSGTTSLRLSSRRIRSPAAGTVGFHGLDMVAAF